MTTLFLLTLLLNLLDGDQVGTGGTSPPSSYMYMYVTCLVYVTMPPSLVVRRWKGEVGGGEEKEGGPEVEGLAGRQAGRDMHEKRQGWKTW